MIGTDSKLIAIDFDGTIAEDKYPKIGKPMTFAFETLKALQNDGHRLILWTYRSGNRLQDAVDFCLENGIEFYAVNSSFPGEEFDEKTQSRKLAADIFVDDRNVGGFIGWGEVYQKISGKGSEDLQAQFKTKRKKKGFFKF